MIGRHYQRDSYNCAHFVADYYRDNLGIEIPVVNEFSLSFVKWLRTRFIRVDKPSEHCLVVMVQNNSSHIGVYADRGVYHNYKPVIGNGSVVHTQLSAIKRMYSKVTYWQWLK